MRWGASAIHPEYWTRVGRLRGQRSVHSCWPIWFMRGRDTTIGDGRPRERHRPTSGVTRRPTRCKGDERKMEERRGGRAFIRRGTRGGSSGAAPCPKRSRHTRSGRHQSTSLSEESDRKLRRIELHLSCIFCCGSQGLFLCCGRTIEPLGR